nr:Chain C, Nucleoprotein [Severe acute respiratory syndrome coronavirus 2]
GMSRIGMEV